MKTPKNIFERRDKLNKQSDVCRKLNMQKSNVQIKNKDLKPKLLKYREPDKRNAKESTIATKFHSSCGQERQSSIGRESPFRHKVVYSVDNGRSLRQKSIPHEQ